MMAHRVIIWDHEGRGMMDDIIQLLGTIPWPLEHIYARDKSLTSNLLILLFFSHILSQMTVYDGPWDDYMGS